MGTFDGPARKDVGPMWLVTEQIFRLKVWALRRNLSHQGDFTSGAIIRLLSDEHEASFCLVLKF